MQRPKQNPTPSPNAAREEQAPPLHALEIGQFDFVHVSRYLHRPLFPIIRNLVAPGGFVLYSTFMHPSQGKPRRKRFLLQENELAAVFSDFDVHMFQHTKLDDGRPFQVILAQKRTK
jgi:tellurite methyltransferase